MVRETAIVLLAREAFFLSGSDDLSVDEECRCVVVLECGYSNSSHVPGPLEF